VVAAVAGAPDAEAAAAGLLKNQEDIGNAVALVYGETAGQALTDLLKTDGAVAKRFGVICTPHAFVLDGELKVVYRGRIDDSRVGDKITSRDLENGLADLVAGRPVAVRRTAPFGCAIVW
jgi:protein-disulfide isomerase